MDALLGSKSLPPGFRFHPTDEELFMFYLKRKVMRKSLGPQMISEVDVFQFAPWELPPKACLKSRDLNWYFLCPRSKKYPNGGRANRATIHGYWKSTGNDRTVNFKNRPVGKIKTLIFHRGKPPKGDRTDWVMHEYRLEDRVLLEQGVAQDSYVICKIFEKSGLGPKNGESYGAPFVEEEWDSDNDDKFESDHGHLLHPCALNTRIQKPISMDIAHSLNGSVITSNVACHNSAGPSTPGTVQQPAFAAVEELPPIETEEDELDRLLAVFTECDGGIQAPEIDVFSGLEDLAGWSSNPVPNGHWSQYLSEDCHNSAGPSTPGTVQQPACAAVEELPPIETGEDELDRLLAVFTECDGGIQAPEIEFFSGLEDLAGGSSNPVPNGPWSQYLSEDWYLELNDLED